MKKRSIVLFLCAAILLLSGCSSSGSVVSDNTDEPAISDSSSVSDVLKRDEEKAPVAAPASEAPAEASVETKPEVPSADPTEAVTEPSSPSADPSESPASSGGDSASVGEHTAELQTLFADWGPIEWHPDEEHYTLYPEGDIVSLLDILAEDPDNPEALSIWSEFCDVMVDISDAYDCAICVYDPADTDNFLLAAAYGQLVFSVW